MRSPPELGGLVRTLIKGHEGPGNRRRGVGRRFYSGGGAIPNPRNCVGVLLVTDALASVLQALHDHRGRGRADDRNVRPDGSKQSHVVEMRMRNDHGVRRESYRLGWREIGREKLRPIGGPEVGDQPGLPQIMKAPTTAWLQKLPKKPAERSEVQSEVQKQAAALRLNAELGATDRFVTIKENQLHPITEAIQRPCDGDGPELGPSRPGQPRRRGPQDAELAQPHSEMSLASHP